jgi:hypothetical protein
MYKTYKNLTIRNATVEDALLLSAWWNDGSIMEHAGYHMGTGETPDMIAEKNPQGFRYNLSPLDY